MKLKIIDVHGTANTTYKKGRPKKYIVIHYSSGYHSDKGAARDLCAWFANPKAQASADFSVDDVDTYQYNGDIDNRYCWAVGGGKYNTKGGRLYGVAKNENSISIEIVSRNTHKKITYANDPAYSFSDAAVSNALELTKYLMEKYSIDADHVIRHYDVNGKPCPGVIGWNADSGSEEAWKSFKARLVGKQESKQESKQAAFDGNGIPPSKQAYIDTVAAIAVDLYPETKILPSVVIAQCCLETGYGLGSDSVALMKVNNLLGMKADLLNSTWSDFTVWKGGWIVKNTPEVYNGVVTRINDAFRVYTDYAECIRDYEMFLLNVKNSGGYKYRSIQGKKIPAEVIHIIRTGGYATDPRYETKVLNIIEENSFTKYDKVAQEGGSTMPTVTTKAPTTICEGAEIVRQSIRKGGWKYTQGPHETSFAKAVNNKKKYTNCGRAILWALVMIGDLTEGPYFYGNKGRLVWGRGAEAEMKKAGWTVTHVNGKYTVAEAIKNGVLKKGDIVTYQTLAHTNLYAGDNCWYDFGHAYSGGSGNGTPLKEAYGKTVYGKYAISYIIRKTGKEEKKDEPKKNTTYRVRIGVFSVASVMQNTASVLKKAGYDTFTEKISSGTALYCGSYSSKKNAEARIEELKKIKVSGKALAPVIVEK